MRVLCGCYIDSFTLSEYIPQYQVNSRPSKEEEYPCTT